MTDLLNPSTLIPSATDPLSISSFLDSPEMRRQRMWDTLGGIGMAMLQASGPSPYQRGFGDVLAAGLAGGAQAGMGSEDRYLKRAMVGAQVAKARSDIANDKAWSDMFKGPAAQAAMAPPAAASAPAPAPQAGPGDYQATVGRIESGNNYTIPNAKGSGAYGKYQFMPQTWADVAAKNPQLGLPFDMRQATPEHQEAAMQALTAMNTQALQGGGINPSPVNLWLAHRFGADGAKKVLSSDPGTLISSLFPPIWTQQNPDMQGKTVAQFVQGGAANFGPQVAQGDTGPTNQGDGSGSPVQPAQYSPQAARPQTLQDIVNQMTPAERQLVTAMGRVKGMEYITNKYASPEQTAVYDTQSGQVVFAPKTVVGRDPRFQPIEGQKLLIERDKLANSQRQTDIQDRNANVVQTPGGPMLNPTLEQKADAEAHRKMVEGDYTEARKANSTAQEGALQARTGLANINRLSGLLDQVQTGRFTSTTQEIKAMAKGLGVDLTALGVADNVGPGEAARALSNQIALTLRNPAGGAGMPGALSDQDRQFLTQMIPSLETTPEGRKLMVEYMKRVYQRQIDVAKISNDFMRTPEAKRDPGKLYTTIQEYADANPLFDPQKDVPTGGMSPMPAPPAGYSVQGGVAPAAPAIPAPPSGFRVVP